MALAGVAYKQFVAECVENPGSPLKWVAAAGISDDGDPDFDEYIDRLIAEFLGAEAIRLDARGMARFRPELIKARRDAHADLQRAAGGDYTPSTAATRYPAPPSARFH